MFRQMIAIEENKLFKRRLVWVELALAVLAVVAIQLILYGVYQAQGSTDNLSVNGEPADPSLLVWPMGLLTALNMAAGNSMGGVLVVVLTAAVVSQAYSWRTQGLWLGRGVSRPALLAARFVALLLPAVLFVIVPLLAGGLLTAIFSYDLLGRLPFAEVPWGALVQATVTAAYTLLPYIALTFCLATISRSTVTAVGVGLSYLFIVDGVLSQLLTMLGGIWAQAAAYLPASLANILMQSSNGLLVISSDEVQAAAGPSPWLAAGILGLYTTVLLIVSFAAFRRQDLGG